MRTLWSRFFSFHPHTCSEIQSKSFGLTDKPLFHGAILLALLGANRSQEMHPRSPTPKWCNQNPPSAPVPELYLLSEHLTVMSPSRQMPASTPEFHQSPNGSPGCLHLRFNQSSFNCSPEAKGPPPSLLLQLSGKGLDSNPVLKAESCVHSPSSGDLPKGNADCVGLSWRASLLHSTIGQGAY